MDIVSVIMPCYNEGIFIEEAVNSVLKQTYREIELVIIDDGSDDKNTIDVIEKISKSSNIEVLYTKRLGPAGARNYGINHAKGKYILPLDADDKIESTYIEKAIAVFENNQNIGLVYCKAYLFGEENENWDLPEFTLSRMLVDNIIFVSSMFYKKDWEIVGGFDVSFQSGMEDYDFFLSLLDMKKEIYQLPEVLFYYRIKKVSRTTKLLGDIDITKEVYKKIFEKHKGLYLENYYDYIIEIRELFIEQIYIRRIYEQRLKKFKLLKKIPIVRWLAKKILKEI